MLQHFANRLRNAFSVVVFGLRILRWCGPRIFLSKMAHQLYSRSVFIVTTLEIDRQHPPSSFQCTLKLASHNEVNELVSNLSQESPDGRYQLLVRKWYHERGLGDCYIARTDDTNEICYAIWVVTAEHIRRVGWEDRFSLDEDEETPENQYTLERFRGRGVRRTATIQYTKIMLELGYRRTRGYVDETNIEQIKHEARIGTRVRAKILERHFLFHVTRKVFEEYNPPIPIAELIDKSNNSISL